MPEGSNLRISSSVVVHGSTEEKTCCSRMRRAMSWVYCPPKSRTTTPPSSELGRWWDCCCIWAPLDIVLLTAIGKTKIEARKAKTKYEKRDAPSTSIGLPLNP